MAGRIKGITVEIGGDTTKLEQALKSVNSTIKTTQSQLKDVNKLLKLDPANTELLSQKQKTLKEAISATKEKLDALKTAQEQAKKQLEEGTLGQDKYDALQREIVETEQELKRLQQEAINANAALEKIDRVGQKMEAAGDSIAGAGKKMMPLTLAIGGVGAAAVKTTADFDEGMSKVSAISGATGKDLDDLRAKAREMGAKTKFSATEAASAFEYMAMAGWKTEDMLDGIEGVMNLAAASGEDLATTSDIVTDALTAFGLSAKDSGHFADILAAASSNANTNVSMMGETFKYCAPIAGALGFSAEDTAEAIGLMANAGIKGSQAGTSLRTIMNNLSGPIDLVGENLGEVTIQTTNADGSMRDLSDILADCRGAFSKLSESEKAQAAESLVGKNAMSGFLALMNAAPGDIDKLSNAIDNCDGTAQGMAETMQDNLSGQLTILKSQLQELAISFGEILMPMIRKIVSKVQAFIDKLNGMSDAQRKTIIKVLALVAAIGPLLIIIGKTISTVGVALQGISKLGKGIIGLASSAKNGTGMIGKLIGSLASMPPIVWIIIAVIAVLTAAFIHLWKNNEEFKNKIIGHWEKLKEKFQEVGQKIVDAFNELGFSFKDIGDVFDWLCNEVFAPLLDFLLGSFMDCIGDIIEVLGGVVQVIIGIIKGFKDGDWSTLWKGIGDIATGIINLLWEPIQWLFHLFGVELDDFDGNWSEVWNKIKNFFVGIWTSIKNFFVGIWEGIKNVVTTAINAVKNTVTTVLTAVSTFFGNIWNAIKSAVSTAWETIKNVMKVGVMFIVELVKAAFNLITLPFRFIWENCKEIILSAWNAIKTTVSSALTAVKTAITTTWNAVMTFLTTVMNGIKTAITTAWNSIKTTVTTVVNAIKTVVTTVWNAIKTALAPILNAIKTAISTVWNAIKTTVTTVVNAIKTTVSTVWNSIKSTVTGVMTGIKSTITSVWNSIKSSVTSVVNGVKSTVSSAFNSIKSTATSIWNSIKSAITTPITNAKNTVSNMIDAIKRKFNFSWSLPHLKLPHLSISGSFSINPPSVPHFGISWYKKAMDGGMILNSPTIFGMKGNNLLGAGEAGSETIVGTQSLMEMIQRAATVNDAPLINVIDTWSSRFMDLFLEYFPQFANAQVVMDSGALVGSIAPAMDDRLGRIASHKGRSN